MLYKISCWMGVRSIVMNLIFSYRGNNINDYSMVNSRIWKNFIEKIRNKLSYLAYATRFKNSKLCLIDENEFVVTVSTRIHKKMLDENYKEMVIEYLTEEVNKINIEQI